MALPASGVTNWGTTLNAHINVGHATDGTHNQAGLQAQKVHTQSGAVNTGTTAIPDDDTIPKITEGDEFITQAITPKSATNKLLIEVVMQLAPSAGAVMTVALFQDATVNALAASREQTTIAQSMPIPLRYEMVAGTTSSTTFRIRAGGTSGTTTFNGVGGARKCGGVLMSSITITETWV